MLHSFLTSALNGGKWPTSRPWPLHSRYRSRWLSGLRRSSAAARSMGLRVRIPPRAGMSLVIVLCCQGEVSSSGWLLFQRSPTEYVCVYVCLSVILRPRQWGDPDFCAVERKNPCCRLNRRLGGPKKPSGRFAEEKKSIFLSGFQPRTVHSVAQTLYCLRYSYITLIDPSWGRHAVLLCNGGSEFLRIKIRWMSVFKWSG